MNRAQKLVRGLATGYVAIGVNILYTFASVPLALHYLTPAEFALWAVASQIAGYLALSDLGVSGAVYRLLIDHKDDRSDGHYGATFQAGWMVFTIQGAVIAGAGLLASPWLAKAMGVEPALTAQLQYLLTGLCAALGFSFAVKIFGVPLHSHQRQDVTNLTAAAHFGVNFGALWLGFALGGQVYAMLFASVVGTVFSAVLQTIGSWRLGFLPRAAEWGWPSPARFREIFFFGGDLFLLSVGWQLVAASQVILVSRMLGLEMTAVWVVGTKVFSLAQQLIWRIFDLAIPALSEMFVRGEAALLRQRLRDVTILTASVAVLIGGCVAATNSAFVHFWTQGRITWEPGNDALMALLTISYSVTRCLSMWVGATKEIRGARYVYFIEGLLFMAGAWWAAPRFGLTGIIAVALLADLLCCGGYGLWRTTVSFRLTREEGVRHWLARPAAYFAVFAPVVLAIAWGVRAFHPIWQLAIAAPLAAVAGLLGFWHLALPGGLRDEIAGRLFRRAN